MEHDGGAPYHPQYGAPRAARRHLGLTMTWPTPIVRALPGATWGQPTTSVPGPTGPVPAPRPTTWS